MSTSNRGRGGSSRGRSGGRQNRGNDRRGNNAKISIHDTLYTEFADTLVALGKPKKAIIGMMRKANITNKSQIQQFMSDALFGNLDDNSQKPTEEAWSSVPKRGDKKVTSGRNNFSSRGAKSGRGRANTRGNDRGDRGRSAPATRTVRPNQQGSGNGRSNFNNNNRTSLDANGRDRNPNPRTTAGNAAHQFRNQQERKVETKTDASAASGIVQQQSKAPVQQTRTKVSANDTKKKSRQRF